MTGIAVVYDATHQNIATLPPNGEYAGYVTGTADVAWTPQDFALHPKAIRIDQSPLSTVWDATADVDDVESGAVPANEIAARAKLRLQAFRAGTRPGQRSPLIYVSQNNVSQVANALVNGGVTSGVGLWLANWNLTDPQATADVQTASGPFPILGVQFHNAGSFDMSVFDTGWFNTVSGPSGAAPVEAVVTWDGEAGLTSRRTMFTPVMWNSLKWYPAG